jgi:hypothetical protein
VALGDRVQIAALIGVVLSSSSPPSSSSAYSSSSLGSRNADLDFTGPCPATPFIVIRRLPERDGEFEYRVRSSYESHEPRGQKLGAKHRGSGRWRAPFWQKMTKKDNSETDEQFWPEVDRAWRMMEKVMRSILRDNPKLDPKNKRDQNAIARLLDERVKNDDGLRRAMAVTAVGGLILDQKTKH